jgi:hypothetical protein
VVAALPLTVIANTARSSVNAARAGHPLHATAQIKAAHAVPDGIVHIPLELAYGMPVNNVLAEVLFSAQNGQTGPDQPALARIPERDSDSPSSALSTRSSPEGAAPDDVRARQGQRSDHHDARTSSRGILNSHDEPALTRKTAQSAHIH